MASTISDAKGQVRGKGLWVAAQVLALLATVAIIAGLFLAPEPALTILWRLLIPLVPASLLVSPMLWRNVCPLATLEMPWAGITGKRVPGLAGLVRGAVTGMVLLGVLVTARHVTFNGANPTDGLVLGVVIALVAVTAVVLGRLFDAKAGFCNTICPVLPVERLYGQSPLVSVGNPRCGTCTACTKVGCIDLGSHRAIPQVLGTAAPERPWFLTHYGAFAAAFPGFVLGYYLIPDGPLVTAGPAFATAAIWSAISFAVVSTVAAVTSVPARLAMPALGAAAVGIYYWFAAPVLAGTLGLGGAAGSASPGAIALRGAAFLLVVVWLARAYTRPQGWDVIGSGAAATR